MGSPRFITSAPSVSPEEYERRYLLGNYSADGKRGREGLVFERGEGSRLFGNDGREYLDFYAGIAVNALGHSDPGISRVLAEQSRKVQHVSNIFHTWEPLRLAKLLVEHSKHFQKVFFCNSGTEANEGALKLAKKYALLAAMRKVSGVEKPPAFNAFGCKSATPTSCFTQGGMCGCWPQAANNDLALGMRNEVVAFKSSFHGRSMGSLAVTHKPAIRYPFGPFPADVRFARFNNIDGACIFDAWCLITEWRQGETQSTPPPSHKRSIPNTLTPIMTSPISDVHKIWTPKVGAIIVEPVQGEGGIYPAEPKFMQALKDKCVQNGALLIVDEVQCGLGRTGRLWAHEAYDVAPDMMTLAKPLAGGLPIGALLMTDAVASTISPGDHGTTYGGNPLVTAVGEHVFSRIAEPSFLASVKARGRELLEGCRALAAAHPHAVAEVRGTLDGGLFVGMELKLPFKALQDAALERGLLIISCGENTVRLCPPLIITKEEVAEGVKILGEAFAAAYPPVQQKQ